MLLDGVMFDSTHRPLANADTGKLHGPTAEDVAAAAAMPAYIVSVADGYRRHGSRDLESAFCLTPMPDALRAVKHDMSEPSPREVRAVKMAHACLVAGFTTDQARLAVPAMLRATEGL